MAYSIQDKENIFNSVFKEITKGRSVRNILKDEGMPSTETFFRWLDDDAIKSKQYVRAIEIRAEMKFDSIESDYLEEPQRGDDGKIDSAWVALQRLKIDAKKWELSKMFSKKYGDKVDVTSDNKAIVTIHPIFGKDSL